MNHNI